MRYTLTYAALLLVMLSLGAQNQPKPEKIQIGFVVSDLIHERYSLEISHLISPSHSLGLRASLADLNPGTGSFYRGVTRAYHLELFHQWYFSFRDAPGKLFFLRSALRFGDAELFYFRDGWAEETRDGSSFLVFERKTLYDQVYKLNFNVSGGIQIQMEHLYFNLYGGLQYDDMMNPESLSIPPSSASFASTNSFIQRGFSPMLGLIVGLGFTR